MNALAPATLASRRRTAALLSPPAEGAPRVLIVSSSCLLRPFFSCGRFGSEAYNGPPGGLAAHDIEWYVDFLARHKFNAILLLFTHEYVLKNDITEAPAGAGPGSLLFQVRVVDS